MVLWSATCKQTSAMSTRDQRTSGLHDGAAHGDPDDQQHYPDLSLEVPIYLSDSNSLWDQLKGQTTEHADPPRFEDEGQSGG
jgi:hypothetical protein